MQAPHEQQIIRWFVSGYLIFGALPQNGQGCRCGTNSSIGTDLDINRLLE